jgi:hypothetical protein
MGIVGSSSQAEQQGSAALFVFGAEVEAFVPAPADMSPRHDSRMPRMKNF